MVNINYRLAGTAVVSTVLALGLSVPALAASTNGGYCSTSSNGCATSMSNTVCAGHGSFGAFGQDANFGNSTSGHVTEPGNANTPSGQGADGAQTGVNNSTLCGNPQS